MILLCCLRYVVPYNRGLLVKYQAHINVEWCHQGDLIKYMFKYVLKGPDRATMVIEKDRQPNKENSGPVDNDEVKNYLTCRYLSSCEACWRIFEFPIHYRKPVVQKLTFHLEKEQIICFNEKESLPSVLRKNHVDSTMFVQWFQANTQYPEGKSLTYVEFPEKFRWDNSAKMWIPRQRNIPVIGRLIYVQPATGELFYMRLLLNIVCGATSFEDLRTVNGVLYKTYKEACLHHNILGDDDEWHTAIKEASSHQTGRQLRHLFVTILLFCDVADLRSLWEKNWQVMSEDIEYNHQRISGDRNFTLSSDRLQALTLYKIDLELHKFGKSLTDFPTLPPLTGSLQHQSQNTLLYEEYMYDRHKLKKESHTLVSMLNPKQMQIFEEITNNVLEKEGGLYFVYGHGGTGKTFLWKTIISSLRSKEKIVLAVASSGIASLLIEGGRTAHSRFKIPLNIYENSTCGIKQHSYLAELISQTDLVVWDEAPMNHKHIFEAVDRSFRDIMRLKDPSNLEKPFGGKTVLLGGDFRQILPVLPKKGRADIVMSSISKSYLWKQCKVFKLDQNMRIEANVPPVTVGGISIPYMEWIIKVGDGTAESVSMDDSGEANLIEIPKELLLDPGDDGKKTIIDKIYSELEARHMEPNYFRDRAILTPINEDVDSINTEVLRRSTGTSCV